MHVGFLVPLVTGVVSGYISKKWHNELAYIIGAIAAVSCLISLIIAPLPIHVIILAAVLIITEKLLWINSCKLNQSDIEQTKEVDFDQQELPIQQSKPSQLFKYRGAAYPPKQH